MPDHETIKEEEERPKPPKPAEVQPRRRKTSAPPRFCFFDYSMIPDKDPRSELYPCHGVLAEREGSVRVTSLY
jgi:hypothetical protein